MSDTAPLSLPDAARHFGVSIRALRAAIRAGTLPRPAHLTATSTLPPAWFASAEAAMEATPRAMARGLRQKVPAFARFEGTSAWRKYSRRAQEYARFRATTAG